jgi:hypothetical protein
LAPAEILQKCYLTPYCTSVFNYEAWGTIATFFAKTAVHHYTVFTRHNSTRAERAPGAGQRAPALFGRLTLFTQQNTFSGQLRPVYALRQ